MQGNLGRVAAQQHEAPFGYVDMDRVRVIPAVDPERPLGDSIAA
jgi:hypothetical protein